MGQRLAPGSLLTAPAGGMKARDVPDLTWVESPGVRAGACLVFFRGRCLRSTLHDPVAFSSHVRLTSCRFWRMRRVPDIGPGRLRVPSPLAHSLSFHRRVVGGMPKVTRTPLSHRVRTKIHGCPIQSLSSINHLQLRVSVKILQTPEGLQRLLWLYACWLLLRIQG